MPTRALDAALTAASPFRPHTVQRALRTSSRVMNQWAPENDRYTSPGLGSLSFTDKLLRPYVARAESAGAVRMFGGSFDRDVVREREIEPTSWIFPRPWYLDELAWLAAARATGEHGAGPLAATAARRQPGASPSPVARGLATSSVSLEFVAPALAGHSASRPVLALPSSFASSAVAPSRAASAQSAFLAASPQAASSPRGGSLASAPVSPSTPSAAAAPPLTRAMRAWTPLVPFQAARAAEVMARTLAASPASASGIRRDEPVVVLEYIAPRDIAGTGAEARHTDAPARPSPPSGQPAPGSSQLAMTEALRNRLARVIARVDERSNAEKLAREASSAATERRAASSPAKAQPAATAGEPAAPEASEARAPLATPAGVSAAPARAVDLLLRAAAAGEVSSVAGPRISLPAGLGGLITAVRASNEITRPIGRSMAAFAAQAMAAFAVQGAMPLAATAYSAGVASGAGSSGDGGAAAADPARQAESDAKTVAPSLPYVAPAPFLASSAYRAITSTRPSSLAHVAWADRWLSRMAGASARSLAALDMTASERPSTAMSLAALAPTPLYISPAAARAGVSMQPAASGTLSAVLDQPTAPRAAESRAGEGSAARRPSAPRIADDEAVSDDVFAAIAAARARPASAAEREAKARLASSPASAVRALADNRAVPAGQAASSSDDAAGDARVTTPSGRQRPVIDKLIELGPMAPDAGMRAALAASPAAPALGTFMALPATRSFDLRAIFASRLAEAYLAGMVEPSFSVLGMSGGQVSGITDMSDASAAGAGQPAIGLYALATRAPYTELVTPVAGDIVQAGQPAASGPLAASEVAARSAGRGTTNEARISPAVTTRGSISAMAAPASIMTSLLLPTPEARLEQLTHLPAQAGPGQLLWTMATQTVGHDPATLATEATPDIAMALASIPASRGPIDHRPGQTATRAEAWSVAEERRAADLSLDFVTPELVLAARAYGLGPADAVRAARLAVAGRPGLASLAAAVDLAFVDAFAHARRIGASDERSLAAPVQMAAAAGAPVASLTARDVPSAGSQPGLATNLAGQLPAPTPQATIPARKSAAAGDLAASTPGPARQATIPARNPKGAFLWPSAAFSLLDIAPGADSPAQPMSLAALDLLAAQAVADVGIFVAPDGTPLSTSALGQPGVPGSERAADPAVIAGAATSASAPVIAETSAARAAASADLALLEGLPGAAASEAPADSAGPDLAALAASLPGAVPRQFDAIYAALARSTAGRSLSPTVRAARALALANLIGQSVGPGRATTAQMRAAAAWAVMPMVIPGDAGDPAVQALAGDLAEGQKASQGAQAPGRSDGAAVRAGASRSAAQATGRSAGFTPDVVAPRELRRAASQAGDSLQSFVIAQESSGTTTFGSQASSSSASAAPAGAVLRAPTAAQPLIQTGGESSASSAVIKEMVRAAQQKRVAGSSNVPDWFEKAARHMFDDSAGGGISLAEMTLVAAAPSHHIAASPKTANAVTPDQGPASEGSTETEGEKPTEDIEEIAQRVYREICQMLRLAEMRNKGRPYT